MLIEEALALLRASLPSTIEIHQAITKDVGPVLADPTQLHQVLLNLCANAAHAMRETGGRLEVRLEAVEVDEQVIGAASRVAAWALCLHYRDRYRPWYDTRSHGTHL